MPDRNTRSPLDRIAVIDVGSNSLRLAVFERLGETLLPLLNEKVMCGLGRGIAATGRLHPEGVALALPNLQRFVALARALRVDHLAIIATAAMRDAIDGRAFAAQIEQSCGVPVRIIPGVEEARLSAGGVLAGIPDADGIVADLGGGSVELIPVNASGGARAIGEGVSLPLGALRLAELDGNRRKLNDTIDRAIAAARLTNTAAGKSLYLVGGAWRAIARLHMEQVRYPLHIIHYYTLDRRSADNFLDIVARLSRRSIERITTVNRKRLELVPLAALILRRLVATAAPERIVFSAYGLREGYAHSLLPDTPRDPLIAACAALAATESRWRSDGERLQQWTAPIFPTLGPDGRRRHSAACWLSDVAWTEHPDYRAEQAFTRILRIPIEAISHSERAFIALVVHARYGAPEGGPVMALLPPVLDEQSINAARVLGLALRLAYTLCGGALELLAQTGLRREAENLVLELPENDAIYAGEAVQRRFETLSRTMGLNPLRRRRIAARVLA